MPWWGNTDSIVDHHQSWRAIMRHHGVSRGSSPIMMCHDGALRNQSWIATKHDEESRNQLWIITNNHATWWGITKSIVDHHQTWWGITKSIVDHRRTCHAMMGHHETHRGSSPIMMCHDEASRNPSWIITKHDVPGWGITKSIVVHHQSWRAMMGHHETHRVSSPIMMHWHHKIHCKSLCTFTHHDLASYEIPNSDTLWWCITKSRKDHHQSWYADHQRVDHACWCSLDFEKRHFVSWKYVCFHISVLDQKGTFTNCSASRSWLATFSMYFRFTEVCFDHILVSQLCKLKNRQPGPNPVVTERDWELSLLKLISIRLRVWLVWWRLIGDW